MRLPLVWVRLLVPLLLINRSENIRQNNLLLGLLFVLITGLISAAVATANNYAVDTDLPLLVVLFYTVFGVFCGAVVSFVIKNGLFGSFREKIVFPAKGQVKGKIAVFTDID